MYQLAIVTLLTLLACPLDTLAQSCAGHPVAVQILGSGGPRLSPDRASSSYLPWINDHARILVGFVEFARDAHVLIMHVAVAAGTTNDLLHASPATVGRVARDAGVGRLILSHIGLFDLGSAVAELKKFYTGPLTIGADLQCTQVR